MSWAAASMLRLSSNCTVIEVEPRPLVDVIWLTPGIWANCRSSGVATDDAMVSGLAPGSDALTWMVGKSTCGSGATGSRVNAHTPESTIEAARRVVAIGRRTNGAEMFTARLRRMAGPRAGNGTRAPA